MSYRVKFSKTAKKQIRKMDNTTSTIIIAWIRKNIEGCNNPRLHGKALMGEYRDYWRYRVGNYRLISKIEDETITVMILGIGHRKDIY